MRNSIFENKLQTGDIIIEDTHMLQLDNITNPTKIDAIIKSLDDYAIVQAFGIINHQENSHLAKTLDEFIAKKKILKWLVDKGYLFNPEYSCLVNYHKDGMESFYLNISALMRDVDLKSELLASFEGKGYEAYIDELCNPPEANRCPVCGNYRYSPQITGVNGECRTCAFAKNGCEEFVKPLLDQGKVAEALDVKRQLSCSARKPLVASPEELLNAYKASYAISQESDTTRLTRKLLGTLAPNDYTVFETKEYGTVAWRNSYIVQYCDFFDCCIIDGEDGSISELIDRSGILATGQDALDAAYQAVIDARHARMFD